MGKNCETVYTENTKRLVALIRFDQNCDEFNAQIAPFFALIGKAFISGGNGECTHVNRIDANTISMQLSFDNARRFRTYFQLLCDQLPDVNYPLFGVMRDGNPWQIDKLTIKIVGGDDVHKLYQAQNKVWSKNEMCKISSNSIAENFAKYHGLDIANYTLRFGLDAAESIGGFINRADADGAWTVQPYRDWQRTTAEMIGLDLNVWKQGLDTRTRKVQRGSVLGFTDIFFKKNLNEDQINALNQYRNEKMKGDYFRFYNTVGMLKVQISENDEYISFNEYWIDDKTFMNFYADYLNIGNEFYDNLDEVFKIDRELHPGNGKIGDAVATIRKFWEFTKTINASNTFDPSLVWNSKFGIAVTGTASKLDVIIDGTDQLNSETYVKVQPKPGISDKISIIQEEYNLENEFEDVQYTEDKDYYFDENIDTKLQNIYIEENFAALNLN